MSKHHNAVLISKDDYDAITETAYLLRNAKGPERLLAALDAANHLVYLVTDTHTVALQARDHC